MKSRAGIIFSFIFVCFAFVFIACFVFAQQMETEAPEASTIRETAAVGISEPGEQAATLVSSQEAITHETATSTDKQLEQEKKPVVVKDIPYVGEEKCKVCHPQEYESQSKRKFSKSWKILKMRGEQNNPECVKCHTAGAGKPGGFISETETPHLTGKQCESCHGPGGKHVKAPNSLVERERLKASNKEKNVCLECHVCMITHRTISF